MVSATTAHSTYLTASGGESSFLKSRSDYQPIKSPNVDDNEDVQSSFYKVAAVLLHSHKARRIKEY